MLSLLLPLSGKSITKKEACEILNISYNTTRLAKLIEDYNEQKEYVATRKKQNKGRPASNQEIGDAVQGYLSNESITEIAKNLYRSVAFVKNLLDSVGVPQRPSSVEDKLATDYIPEACVSETFDVGEKVWSARHHKVAVIEREYSPEYQKSKPGIKFIDYEKTHASKCYSIYLIESVDAEDTLFPGVETGGYSAFSMAYDLAKLSHLEQYGVRL